MPCVGSSSMRSFGCERHADRDLDPALIAMGQVADQLARVVPKAEFRQHLLGARARRGQAIQANQIATASLQALAGEPHVLEDAQTEEQVGDLERARHADAGQGVGRLAGNVASVQLDLAGIRPQRSGDEIERCALAGAVRSDDRRDAMALRLEAEVIDGPQPTEGLAQIRRP